MSLTVAVVGATGAVGREMLTVLEQRKFPASSVRAFASPRSAGTKIPIGRPGTQRYGVKHSQPHICGGYTAESPGPKAGATASSSRLKTVTPIKLRGNMHSQQVREKVSSITVVFGQ